MRVPCGRVALGPVSCCVGFRPATIAEDTSVAFVMSCRFVFRNVLFHTYAGLGHDDYVWPRVPPLRRRCICGTARALIPAASKRFIPFSIDEFALSDLLMTLMPLSSSSDFGGTSADRGPPWRSPRNGRRSLGDSGRFQTKPDTTRDRTESNASARHRHIVSAITKSMYPG